MYSTHLKVPNITYTLFHPSIKTYFNIIAIRKHKVFEKKNFCTITETTNALRLANQVASVRKG